MKHFTILTLITLVSIGCEKSEEIKLEDGTYVGSFTVQYPDMENTTHEVSITFEGDRYTCSSGPNRMPAGGSGTFFIEDQTITFTDENVWTAEFDWGLILNGEYQVQMQQENISIERVINSHSLYSYEVKKENP